MPGDDADMEVEDTTTSVDVQGTRLQVSQQLAVIATEVPTCEEAYWTSPSPSPRTIKKQPDQTSCQTPWTTLTSAAAHHRVFLFLCILIMTSQPFLFIIFTPHLSDIIKI